MENFHIEPTGPLASQAAPFVRALLEQGHRMVAVRGQHDPTGWHPDMIYGVFAAPADHNKGGYVWSYVDAAEWLRRYEELAANTMPA